MDKFGGIVDSRFERDEMGCWHSIVSCDIEIFVGKLTVHKMLFIGLKRPGVNVFDKVRRVGQRLENHRDFVQMVQIIGRQKAFFY